jgi:hypothetical protein
MPWLELLEIDIIISNQTALIQNIRRLVLAKYIGNPSLFSSSFKFYQAVDRD